MGHVRLGTRRMDDREAASVPGPGGRADGGHIPGRGERRHRPVAHAHTEPDALPPDAEPRLRRGPDATLAEKLG